MHKKPPDLERRKRAAVFQEPIALRQSLFDDTHEPAAGAGREQCQPDVERRIQQRRTRIGLDPPQCGILGVGRADLEGGDRAGQLVERGGHFERGLGALDFCDDPNGTGH